MYRSDQLPLKRDMPVAAFTLCAVIVPTAGIAASMAGSYFGV